MVRQVKPAEQATKLKLVIGNSSFRKLQQGFTLIEVMIVVLIIAIVIGAVSMTISRSDTGQKTRSDINIFRARLLYAEQRALIESRTLGVAVSTEGYQFYRYQLDTTHPQGIWQVIHDDQALNPQQWYSFASPTLQLVGIGEMAVHDTMPTLPMLVMTADGGITPFIFQLGGYRLQGNYDGQITFLSK